PRPHPTRWPRDRLLLRLRQTRPPCEFLARVQPAQHHVPREASARPIARPRPSVGARNHRSQHDGRQKELFLHAPRPPRRGTGPHSHAHQAGPILSPKPPGAVRMGHVTARDGTRIFYKDWGSGQPIVFSHGWPLCADAWDPQMLVFGKRGFRVIAHDRRGHGRSDQTWTGNDMDTYADDLARIIE